MVKIKDRIVLGIASGLLCSIPGRLFNKMQRILGLTDLTYEQQAASIFVHRNQLDTAPSKIVGYVTNQFLAASLGVVTAYLLSATGRDSALVKGVGVSLTYWMLLEGLTRRLGLALPSRRATSPFLSLLNHVIFGAFCGPVTAMLGDDRLFPEASGQIPSPFQGGYIDNGLEGKREPVPVI
ncbi:MAG: hypothetical protein WBK48_06835 [Dethiobacteria bacterium]|jgi:hypothetical protein|nr:hypothetical protein [Bacillota bacterium]HOP69058.1 hypothetical protein [Bacillota bacterium]HPT33690.1 hypothetical protein [Bacillota bacterium]HPZ65569.1 hypothetical protein [Bacillota bacterium]HQD06898.1 hypothetical protein [Bacillota bacterium]